MTAVVTGLSPDLKSRQLLHDAGLIASFLGAVHWGTEIYRRQGLRPSTLVIPCLLTAAATVPVVAT